MPIADLQSIDTDVSITADLCLVGSGPAGWTIAEELRNSGLDILMLESGGQVLEPETIALTQYENHGIQLLNGRNRILGGTSHSWSGRCIAFDDLDYSARSWIPLSGWPIGRDAIAPYLDRAGAYLGAGLYQPNGTYPMPEGLKPRPDVDPTILRTTLWEDPDPVRLGPLFQANQHRRLRILLHATVTHLNTNESGRRILSVEVSDPHGRRATVSARTVVLCAGGIENARILLYSNRIIPGGVGNIYDVVGRYFMDHPRDVGMALRFDTRDADWVYDMFGPYKLNGPRGRHCFLHGFALSPDLQRRDQLLNCAAWPNEILADDDPVEAVKRLVRGPRDRALHDAGLALSQPGYMLRGLYARLLKDQRAAHKVARIGFLVASEQLPDRDCRVWLGDQKDSLGLPVANIGWRIGSLERESQAVLAKSIVSEFERLGLPRMQVADWVLDGKHEEAELVDGCHPSGTTRMASDPRHGVVDAECQVHGVDGLYVAGSSVFPTNGHANPTLMIVALASRLAHTLQQRLTAVG
jgi:choline dehydrogenase-like flavoprotein